MATSSRSSSDSRRRGISYSEPVREDIQSTHFTCEVSVGEKSWQGEGLSIKRVKHAAAKKAYCELKCRHEGAEDSRTHDPLSIGMAALNIKDQSIDKYISKLSNLTKKHGLPEPVYGELIKQECQPRFSCYAVRGNFKAIGYGSSKTSAKKNAADNLQERERAHPNQEPQSQQQSLPLNNSPSIRECVSSGLSPQTRQKWRDGITSSQMRPQLRHSVEHSESGYQSRFKEDFNVIHVIAEGGYGIVFKARHNTDDNIYAVKRVDIDESDMTEEEVSQEAAILAQLDHPNIVSYKTTWTEKPPMQWQMQEDKSYPGFDEYDFDGEEGEDVPINTYPGDTKHFLYIKMEFCPKTLTEWLRNEARTLDRRSKLRTFCQIVSAVEYIHKKGLIHRDIKPSNIFISETQQVKLGDFGLARNYAPSDSSAGNLTKSVAQGYYLSPEQKNKTNYDNKVDIFPLGIMWVEFYIPFGSESERHTILENARNRELPDDFMETYPSETHLIRKMTNPDPVYRPMATDILHDPFFKSIF